MDILKSSLFLSIDICVWFCTYLYVRYKYGKLAIGTVLILLYTIINVVGAYIYLHPNGRIYFDNKLTLFPLLYLYLMIIISIIPLFHFSPRYIDAIYLPPKRLLNLTCIIFSSFTIISLIKIIPDLKTGLIGMIIDSSYASDQYATATYNRMNEVKTSGLNILSILGNVSVRITPVLFFTYLIQPKRNKVIMIMLILSLMVTPLAGIAQASRLSIVTSFLIYGLLYIFFLPYLNRKLKKKVNRCIMYVVLFFGLFFMLISIGRSSNSNSDISIGYGFARYLGEGPIVFDNYCLDAGGTREGNYTFPMQHILKRSSQLNESELRDKYRNLKVDSSRFYTFVGDFTLDYGPIGAAFIFILIFLLVYNKTIIRKKRMTFSQIILCYVLIYFCGGFYQYQFSMSLGNATLLMLVMLYVFFDLYRRIYPKKYQRIECPTISLT